MASDRPRAAASVILVRERAGKPAAAGAEGGPLEVLLLRRHRKASFMSSSFVFPGGTADEGESDPRETAARELFEEAGVLLADPPLEAARLATMRRRLRKGETWGDLFAAAGAEPALDRLVYFAHWVTPSVEPKRFSARFFIAALPEGQEPSCDDEETVDQVWVTPEEALARAGELRLPPPQVRTFAELQEPAARGLEALIHAARRRADRPHPILPRLCPQKSGFALLLPWDPEYESRGTGEAIPMPPDHPLAHGPSRFVLEDGTWKNVPAPASPSEG